MSQRFDSERPDVDDILGAYALDAVDPAEREMVERHLADDPVARRGRRDARDRRRARVAPRRRRRRARGSVGTHRRRDRRTQSRPQGPTPTNVVPLTRATRSFPARIVVPIVAAAALVIAVLGVQVATRTPNRAGDLAAAYNHAVARTAPTTVAVAGRNRGHGRDRGQRFDGSGYLRNEHLAALPAGKTYQLWAVTGHGNAARTISAGVLGADPSAAAFHLAKSARRVRDHGRVRARSRRVEERPHRRRVVVIRPAT